jgi:hypothetical protein
MSQLIFTQLSMAYNIIKFIHSLYLKYNNFIDFKSFESCGKGIDTIYNIKQCNMKGPILLSIKIHYIKQYDNIQIKTIDQLCDYILFLPTSIITPIGIWKFIDSPSYKIIDKQFTLDLIKHFNFKFIYPSYTDIYSEVHDPIFIPYKYFKDINYNNFDNLLDEDIRLDIRHLFRVYNYRDLDKFNPKIELFFNKLILGPEICIHIFENFIKNMLDSNVFDDNNLYYKYYISSINKQDYYSLLKDFFHSHGKYGFDKTIYKCIFYYTYLNYFYIYNLFE